MHLSEAKKQAAYNAIADAVMDARVNLRTLGLRDSSIDFVVAQITERAWRQLKAALSVSDVPPNG